MKVLGLDEKSEHVGQNDRQGRSNITGRTVLKLSRCGGCFKRPMGRFSSVHPLFHA
jgi:hypothetical protein